MSHGRRLERLEQAAGGSGEGCHVCRGMDLTQFWIDDTRNPPISKQPKPEPVICENCGRDRLRLTIIRIVEGSMPE